jgi:hypothetical protein
MRKTNLLLIFILISIFVRAQSPIYGQEYYWVHPNHIVETYDKGFLVTFDFQEADGIAYNSGLLKVDINRNLLWIKLMGNNSQFMQIKGIAKCPDGGIVLSGQTCLIDSYADPFVMKLNACMEPEWCNIYSTPGLDDLAGEVVFVPEENAFIVYMLDNHPHQVAERIFLMKIDSTGNTEWKNSYVTNPEYIGELPLGLIYSQQDTSVLLRGFVYAYEDSTGMYALQPYWSKIKTNGDMLWETFRIPDSSFTYGLSRRDPLILASNNIIAPVIGSSKGRFVNLSAKGTFQKITTLYQPDTIIGVTINSTALINDYYYTGAQFFVTGFDGIGYAAIVKNDTAGNYINQTILPVNFTDVISDICISTDDKLMISAGYDLHQSGFILLKYNANLEYDSIYNQTIIYDSLCPESISSGAIEMNCNIVTDVSAKPLSSTSTLKFAPNPATEFTIITLPETIMTGEKTGFFNVKSFRADYVKDLWMDVYDINGHQIYSKRWPDNVKEQVLPVAGFSRGLYLIQVRNEQRIISSGKLLVTQS